MTTSNCSMIINGQTTNIPDQTITLKPANCDTTPTPPASNPCNEVFACTGPDTNLSCTGKISNVTFMTSTMTKQ